MGEGARKLPKGVSLGKIQLKVRGGSVRAEREV